MGRDDAETPDRLAPLLGVPERGGEDWDLINADAERVEEFCRVYESEPLSRDDRAALMELIVASYDERLRQDGRADERADDLEARIARLLKRDFGLHRHTIEYWSAIDSPDPRGAWLVTPLMRRILEGRGGGK